MRENAETIPQSCEVNFLKKEEKVNGKGMRGQEGETGARYPITSFVLIKL